MRCVAPHAPTGHTALPLRAPTPLRRGPRSLGVALNCAHLLCAWPSPSALHGQARAGSPVQVERTAIIAVAIYNLGCAIERYGGGGSYADGTPFEWEADAHWCYEMTQAIVDRDLARPHPIAMAIHEQLMHSSRDGGEPRSLAPPAYSHNVPSQAPLLYPYAEAHRTDGGGASALPADALAKISSDDGGLDAQWRPPSPVRVAAPPPPIMVRDARRRRPQPLGKTVLGQRLNGVGFGVGWPQFTLIEMQAGGGPLHAGEAAGGRASPAQRHGGLGMTTPAMSSPNEFSPHASTPAYPPIHPSRHPTAAGDALDISSMSIGQVFARFDYDGSGTIGVRELRDALGYLGLQLDAPQVTHRPQDLSVRSRQHPNCWLPWPQPSATRCRAARRRSAGHDSDAGGLYLRRRCASPVLTAPSPSLAASCRRPRASSSNTTSRRTPARAHVSTRS